MALDPDPLLGLATHLGVQKSDVVSAEALDELQLRVGVNKADLAKIPWEAFVRFHKEYGAKGTIDLYSGRFDAGSLPADRAEAAWLADLRNLPEELTIEVRIDKAGSRNTRHFLFYDTFVRTFKSSSDLNPLGDFDPLERLCITVGDRAICVDASYLSIRGADCEGEPGTVEDVLESRRKRHSEAVGLDAAGGLTPWSFHLPAEHGETVADLVPHLQGRTLHLLLQYLGDQVRRERPSDPSSPLLVDFKGPERTLTVQLDVAQLVDLCSTRDRSEYHDAFEVLGWCYPDFAEKAAEDWTRERLNIVQARVARAVPPAEATDQAGPTVRAVASLKPHLDAFWKAFLDGEIAKYLATLADVEKTIGTAIDTFGARSQDIVDNLTKGVLGAVGALIGSAIAAAFKTPFNDDLFRAGMIVYLAYFVLFPFALGTWSIYRRWGATTAQYGYRQEEFIRLLGEKYVEDNVEGRTKSVVETFWITFVVSIFLYLAVSGLMIWLIDQVPIWVES